MNPPTWQTSQQTYCPVSLHITTNILRSAQYRCTSQQTYCGLPSITAHRTLLSCFLLAQKTSGLHNLFPTWSNVFLACCLGVKLLISGWQRSTGCYNSLREIG